MRRLLKYSDVGLVDTVMFALQIPYELQGADGFEAMGWKVTRNKYGVIYKAFNPKTNMRVFFWKKTLMVENEITRVLGHKTNQYVERITIVQLRSAIQKMTKELFPEQTRWAFRRGRDWRMTQMDLAMNYIFNGKAARLMPDRLFRLLRWKRTRAVNRRWKNKRPTTRGAGWEKHVTKEERLSGKKVKNRRWGLKMYSKTTHLMKKYRRSHPLPPIGLWRAELHIHGAGPLRVIADRMPWRKVREIRIGMKNGRRFALDYLSLHAELIAALADFTFKHKSQITTSANIHREWIDLCYPGLFDWWLRLSERRSSSDADV
jgi:hypothetical protein